MKKKGGKTTYQLGPEEGMLVARVPVYGKLAVLDRDGPAGRERASTSATNGPTAASSTGGTSATAIWTFEGVTEDQFPNGLAHRNDHRGLPHLQGRYRERRARQPVGPKPQDRRDGRPSGSFESKEFVVDLQPFRANCRRNDGKKLDLFKDLVSDGKVEIWLRCAAPSQNFGVAQADMYLRAGNASFGWNFVKGYLGIWLQSLLVIALGVTFSTFLSGPVAMIATLGALVGGFFNDFMYRLATQQTYGGGPFESLYRLLTQQNVTSELPPGLTTTVVKTLDQPAQFGLWLLASMILPDFGHFSFSEYVASGFNIPGDTVLMYTCRAFAFLLPVFVAGYLCLKNREVAK